MTVYRFGLDKCTLVDGVLSDNPYHPNKPAWFAKNIDSIASFGGISPEELRKLFCSDNPVERGLAYELLGHYSGFFELDHYPLNVTRAEAKRRYRRFSR